MICRHNSVIFSNSLSMKNRNDNDKRFKLLHTVLLLFAADVPFLYCAGQAALCYRNLPDILCKRFKYSDVRTSHFCLIFSKFIFFAKLILSLLFFQIENIRRRHNYLPFIMELLKILAEDGKLVGLVEKVIVYS